eukprot:765063-Hanusia_phi.AAC.7
MPRDRVVLVAPRRTNREILTCSPKKPPLALSYSSISSLFFLRQADAAARLGISLSALKTACKVVGVESWPSPRKANLKDRRTRSDRSGESANETRTKRENRLAGEIGELFDEALAHVDDNTDRKVREKFQRDHDGERIYIYLLAASRQNLRQSNKETARQKGRITDIKAAN